MLDDTSESTRHGRGAQAWNRKRESKKRASEEKTAPPPIVAPPSHLWWRRKLVDRKQRSSFSFQFRGNRIPYESQVVTKNRKKTCRNVIGGLMVAGKRVSNGYKRRKLRVGVEKPRCVKERKGTNFYSKKKGSKNARTNWWQGLTESRSRFDRFSPRISWNSWRVFLELLPIEERRCVTRERGVFSKRKSVLAFY